MARSTLIFSKDSGGRHALTVKGDPEKVVGVLKNGWAQLDAAAEDDETKWVWVNEARVLYVEPYPEGGPFVA